MDQSKISSKYIYSNLPFNSRPRIGYLQIVCSWIWYYSIALSKMLMNCLNFGRDLSHLYYFLEMRREVFFDTFDNRMIWIWFICFAARKNGEGSRDQESEGTAATREQGKRPSCLSFQNHLWFYGLWFFLKTLCIKQIHTNDCCWISFSFFVLSTIDMFVTCCTGNSC